MGSSNNWTLEQAEAIETSGCDLLVAAAAGSGKTAVLVERIIRRVTDADRAIDIDKLLVVTFTNAAASEMRERIGDAISRELDINPDSRILQRQLTLLPKSSITTIHSFCLDVIRNNFHVINIDPGFRISDETEITLLKQEAIEELFDTKYEAEDNEGFLALVESYGGNRSDERLEEIVLDIYKFSESAPWPEKWLSSAAEDYNISEEFVFQESKWAKYLLKNIKIEITGLIANMKRAIYALEEDEALGVYVVNFNSELLQLEDILASAEASWNSLYTCLNEITFGRLKSCKNADEALKKYVTGIRDDVKKKIKRIQNSVIGIDEEKIKTEMKALYPVMKALSELVIEFKGIFREKKRDRSIIDFNDIEHYALNILTSMDEEGNIIPSDTALLYRDKFEEVLIDEYQDSNLVQEVILNMVARRDEDNKNLFMVGDVKQSIYRFRQAMPELFLRKYNTFTEKEGTQRKITLFKNFRSRKEVVDGVNYIFKLIMSENIGELNYNEREALNLGASYPDIDDIGITGGPIELHIIENDNLSLEEDEDTDEELDVGVDGNDTNDRNTELDEEDVDNIQLEARMVVSRIKGLVEGTEEKEFKVYDKSLKAYRRVEYRDIVILLRATKNWANIFLDEFSKERIPAFADTGSGYFDTIEIKTILSLLQVIDNPMQDIPLLSVLRSPIFSFTPEELIDIRLMIDNVSMYEAMQLIASTGLSATAIKVEEFIKKINGWHRKSIYTPIDEFLWSLYMDTGYFSYVSAMPGGVQRQANLKVLFERAKQYENTSYKGLFNFINFINKLKRNSGDMGSAKILGENENVVRIMSIHKSKGLEFPVVIAAGMGKGFNMLDLNKAILFHKELGFGADFVDYKRRYTYPSTMKEAIKTRIKLETLSEEMRVLYVAFTRAKEKLIIIGSVKNVDKAIGKWGQSSEKVAGKLSEYEVLSSKSYLDWICPAVMNHRDGQRLTEIGNYILKHELEDEGKWEVSIWNRREVLEYKSSKTVQIANTEENVEGSADEYPENQNDEEGIYNIDPSGSYSDYRDEIVDRLDYVYPYEGCHGIPAKLSVSEFKRAKSHEIEDAEAAPLFNRGVLRRPVFMEDKEGFSAAEKGTFLHLVMQHLDFLRTNTVDELREQIGKMIKAELLREKEAEVINLWKLQGFFRSPLGDRVKKSSRVIRELPFTVEISAAQVYAELPREKYEDEKIMLQGVIDCFFEEDGEYVLIDYKTDYVEDGNTAIIRDRYSLQIDCYTKAIERITGRRVKGKYIYLFSSGETIEY